MEHDASNKGSYEVINAIGKGKSQPAAEQPPEPETDDEEWLEELQRRYLWECTFEVL